MKQLLLICAVVALVGCGEREYANTRDLNPNNPPPSQVAKPVAENNATQPLRMLTAEEKKVVGAYEHKGGEVIGNFTPSKETIVAGPAFLLVLLKNGNIEHYTNDKKDEVGGKWTIVNGEIHVEDSDMITVYRINKDRNITDIAEIEDGKRTDWLKEDQLTYKRIK